MNDSKVLLKLPASPFLKSFVILTVWGWFAPEWCKTPGRNQLLNPEFTPSESERKALGLGYYKENPSDTQCCTFQRILLCSCLSFPPKASLWGLGKQKCWCQGSPVSSDAQPDSFKGWDQLICCWWFITEVLSFPHASKSA